MPERLPRLILFTRSGCHLCDELRRALLAQRARYPFEIEEHDVDDDAALARRYGERVPVLVGGEREICHYFFDEAAFVRYWRAAHNDEVSR